MHGGRWRKATQTRQGCEGKGSAARSHWRAQGAKLRPFSSIKIYERVTFFLRAAEFLLRGFIFVIFFYPCRCVFYVLRLASTAEGTPQFLVPEDGQPHDGYSWLIFPGSSGIRWLFQSLCATSLPWSMAGGMSQKVCNSYTGQMDPWKWEVLGFQGSLLNTHQDKGKRICPILLQEPLPGSVLAVYSQSPRDVSLALLEMS